MRGKHVLWAILTTVALLAAATPALASDGTPPDGQVIFGEDFVLGAGERLDGDLVVFGGNITLEPGSEVEGDVVAWGGNAEVAGTVWGNLVTFGGNARLLETAVVDGDLVVLGGRVEREEGAEVRGQQVVNPWEGRERWSRPVATPFFWEGYPPSPDFAGRTLLHLLLRGVRLMLTVLLMAGLAGLVALLWPRPAARVGQVGLESLLPSLGVGLLTMLVGGIVVIGLLVTLCLAPVGLAAAVAMGVATVFGWTALGITVGERLTAALTTQTVSPFWSAALGAGLLTFLGGLMGLIPCVGWALGLLVACVGLGAVVLTRFGTVGYPPGPPASPLPAGRAEAVPPASMEEA